jgi:hypothetical protein
MPVFLADLMLKKLCRWLRIFGIKCLYAGDLEDYAQEDDELIRFAIKNKLVLLTSDELLYAKAKDYVHAVLFKTQDTEKQLVQLMRESRIPLSKDFPSKTLCPQCNSPLKEVARKKVKGKVFSAVYARHDVFWVCANKKCGKIYWEGTHWNKIEKTAERVAEEIEKKRRKNK